jgi:hypothetical protein
MWMANVISKHNMGPPEKRLRTPVLDYMVYENNDGPLECSRLPFWIEVFFECLPAFVIIVVQLLACFFTPLCDSKTQ